MKNIDRLILSIAMAEGSLRTLDHVIELACRDGECECLIGQLRDDRRDVERMRDDWVRQLREEA